MSRLSKKTFFHVLLPLLIGYFIYFFFRPNYWFVEIINKREGLINISDANWFQQLLIFSGADFCWAYSLSSALFIWSKWQGQKIRIFPVFTFFIIIFSEAVQYFFSQNFTFDWMDMLAAVLAFALSYIIIFRNVEN